MVQAATGHGSRFAGPRLSGTILVALAPQVLLAAHAIAQRQFESLVYPLPSR